MIEEKESSLTEKSSSDYVTENFDWVYDDNFPEEYKKEFLQFPLKERKEILIKENLLLENKIKSFRERRDDYLKLVYKIFKESIFKDFDFYNDKKVFTEYILNNYKRKVSITPDFFVKKIQNNKFTEILNVRKYMMRTNYQIPDNVEYINIFGEIKLSEKNQKQTFKKSKKKKNYYKFLDEIKNDKEKIVVMHIYDMSFFLFEEDSKIIENFPIVYCYIPKLHNFYSIREPKNTKNKLNSVEYYRKEIKKIANKIKNIRFIYFCMFIIFIAIIIKVYFFH